MPLEDCFVDITGITEAHDDIPFRLLGKHLVSLRHVHLLSQSGGVVPVGHTQQHTSVIGLQSKHLQIARTGYQWTIVVVGGVP